MAQLLDTTIYGSLTVSGNIIPATPNGYNIGSTGSAYASIYAYSITSPGMLIFNGTTNLSIYASNQMVIQASGSLYLKASSYINIVTSSSITLTASSSIYMVGWNGGVSINAYGASTNNPNITLYANRDIYLKAGNRYWRRVYLWTICLYQGL